MADAPRLTIQLPRGSAVERRLTADPPEGVATGAVVFTEGPTDAHGHLDVSIPGEVVLSVPSPEALAREAGEVRRVIARAGTGVEPLVEDAEVPMLVAHDRNAV